MIRRHYTSSSIRKASNSYTPKGMYKLVHRATGIPRQMSHDRYR